MPRWPQIDTEKLVELRRNIGEQLNDHPQYPEVIGDRKLLRFLRGHDYDMEKVCGMVVKHLEWRKENGVNEIRQNILNAGLDRPSKFPKGELILKIIPQVIIAPGAHDKIGSPISVEKYNFSPSEVMAQLNITEYIHFLIHCLEYKSMIVEQISEEREKAFLDSLSEEDRERALSEELSNDDDNAYGVITGLCVIRDLEGLGFDHVGSKGQEILRAVLSVTSDNYPELMRKCLTINSPWIFNALWYFVKGLLAPRTIEKVSVCGSNYMTELLKEMDAEHVPEFIGGTKDADCMGLEAFLFNLEYLCPPHLKETATEDATREPETTTEQTVVDATSVTGQTETDGGNENLETETNNTDVPVSENVDNYQL